MRLNVLVSKIKKKRVANTFMFIQRIMAPVCINIAQFIAEFSKKKKKPLYKHINCWWLTWYQSLPLFFQPALPLKQQTAMVIWKDCSWHTGWVHREFGAIKPRNSKYKLGRQHVQPLGEKGFRTKSLRFTSLLINFSFVTF